MKFRFTKTALQGLAAPDAGKRLSVYDTEQTKLALRVTSAGTKTFYVIKRVGASMVWLKLGVFPDMTVEQARNEAARALGEFASGANPAAVKRAFKAEPTLSEAFKDFTDHKRKRDGSPIGEKTKRDYADIFRLYLGPIANKRLSEIERSDVKSIRDKVTKNSPSQADKVVALVSAVYNHMLDADRYSGPNPAERVKKNPPVQRDRFVQSDEMPHFFRALSEGPTEQMRDFFLLALLTGLRRSNVAAMRWSDVDLKEAVWRVDRTKNGMPQNVALSPEAVEVLASRRSKKSTKDVYVFPSESESGHLQEPKNAWRRVLMLASVFRLSEALQLDEVEQAAVDGLRAKGLERALEHLRAMARKREIDPDQFEIQSLRIHDLRRTLGSWQARAGASLTIIGKSLNHKTHQATAIYARLDLDPVRQSVNTATAAMLEAAGLKQAAEVLELPGGKKAA